MLPRIIISIRIKSLIRRTRRLVKDKAKTTVWERLKLRSAALVIVRWVRGEAEGEAAAAKDSRDRKILDCIDWLTVIDMLIAAAYCGCLLHWLVDSDWHAYCGCLLRLLIATAVIDMLIAAGVALALSDTWGAGWSARRTRRQGKVNWYWYYYKRYENDIKIVVMLIFIIILL